MIQVNIFTEKEILVVENTLIKCTEDFKTWCSIEVDRQQRPDLEVPWVDHKCNIYILLFYYKPNDNLCFQSQRLATLEDLIDNDYTTSMDCCI